MGFTGQPDMPTIVFLTRALDIGGAQRQLVELALGLHRLGWKVHVLLFYGGGALEPQLKNAGVEVVSLGKEGRWAVLGFMRRLVMEIRRARPDFVHGYLDVANMLLGVLRPLFGGSRVVWGVRASNVDLSRYDTLARIVFRVGALSSRLADLVICNSESGRAYHAAHGYPAERMTVIPNGVDSRQFRRSETARREVRDEWGVALDQKLVGIVGRLDPMKDHPNFMRAAARIAAARRDVRFVCVGDGEPAYRASLEALAAELGLGDRLFWAGARTDMWRVYNALDVAVSASAFGEGTSNAIAEAMATGVPCVATAVGDAAALIGDLGWICLPRDHDALANAIVEALAAPCDAEAIRARMVSEFSPESLLRRTAEELSKLSRAGMMVSGSSPRRTKSP
jgi:glycosyltransferase involved in cell wall biosynthesis